MVRNLRAPAGLRLLRRRRSLQRNPGGRAFPVCLSKSGFSFREVSHDPDNLSFADGDVLAGTAFPNTHSVRTSIGCTRGRAAPGSSASACAACIPSFAPENVPRASHCPPARLSVRQGRRRRPAHHHWLAAPLAACRARVGIGSRPAARASAAALAQFAGHADRADGRERSGRRPQRDGGLQQHRDAQGSRHARVVRRAAEGQPSSACWYRSTAFVKASSRRASRSRPTSRRSPGAASHGQAIHSWMVLTLQGGSWRASAVDTFTGPSCVADMHPAPQR